MPAKAWTWARVVSLAFATFSAIGCSLTEHAIVPIRTELEPSRALPASLQTVAILPAECGPDTAPKWRDLTARILAHVIQESGAELEGTLEVADLDETKGAFKQIAFLASDLTDSPEKLRAPARAVGAQACVLSRVRIAVDKQRKSGFSLGQRAGRKSGPVERGGRNITVHTEFHLTDPVTGKNWAAWSPRPYRATQETTPSPLLESHPAKDGLSRLDLLAGTLIERGARDFCSQFIPCAVDYELEVESSASKSCARGVQNLRDGRYSQALEQFTLAIDKDPQDHRAAFAAGVACEKLGRYDEAYAHYRSAYKIKEATRYGDATKRLADHRERIRQPRNDAPGQPPGPAG
jgi:tetratricopeptide (TPR) repeat protein